MINVLIVTHSTAHNKGDEAMIKGLMKTLKNGIQEPLHLSLLTENPEYDCNRFYFDLCRSVYERGKGKIMPVIIMVITLFWALIWRLTRLKFYFYVPHRGQNVLKEYLKAEIIVSRGSDVFNDVYGVQSVLFQSYYVLLGLILKKPVVLCGHAIGPFRNRLVAFYMGKLFNKASLITVRDHASAKWLNAIGVIKPKVQVTADLAFLLDPVPIKMVEKILVNEGIDIKNPIVGLNVSKLISRWGPGVNLNQKYLKYVELMVELADFLVEKLHTNVILIPHVTHPYMDDRDVAKDIMKLVCNKDSIKMIQKDYSTDELKGIIGYCNIFIGARMHSVIAAISTGVPSLAIAYSPKYKGIMELVQQEKWVLDIQTMTFENLSYKILDLWMNKHSIKNHLNSMKQTLNSQAQLNGKLINNVLKLEKLVN